MFKLYHHTGTGGAAVAAALTLAGQPFETVTVDTKTDEQFSDAYRKINPWCQVPALILPDGTLMTETSAMLIHIADTNPGKDLGPAPGTSGHAQLMRWMVFMAINLYEADLHYYYPARYTTDTTPSAVESVKAAGQDHMERAFGVLEDRLAANGPHVLGRDPSVADIYLAMLYEWYPGDRAYPHIAALRDSVAAQAAIETIWRENFAG
ncbi:glutathione S-transferase family protein [Rhodospirillaceae bacterium KN72]|uniref:Glutathione S-transferase family protein n=1 Tax=Pacificispira spongiicola TaxID=2729598 RepID=A0A7Y0E2R7_9PROT|nr:glutathione S-transferase family protein [Pacificispira spongiicola]NMM45421.1 glutathione S-transferase family protein [Pacificispira spongiicola]